MLKLCCVIVGPGNNAFFVEIDKTKTVSELKEAIRAKKPNTTPVEADRMHLFLAKKNDAWLEYDALDAVLQSGDLTSYHRMPEPFKLNDSKLFGDASRGEDVGPDGSLGEGVIHVLVVLPPEMVITPSPDLGRIVRLFCAIVGEGETSPGSLFSVKLDKDMPVDELKKAIKKEKMYKFPADEMGLFMAKKNNKWLDAAGAAALSLDIHGRPQGYAELMDPLLPLKDDKHFGAGFQPGEGQVQVLVVLPFGVTINIEEGKGNAELKLYQDCGKRIRANCGDHCQVILNKIDTLYKLHPKRPLPFICVEGSSGMGKSQLAFALRGSRRWFYWPVTSFGDDSQRIYKNFESISTAFKKVTRDDEPMSKAEDDILNCGSHFYEEKACGRTGSSLCC